MGAKICQNAKQQLSLLVKIRWFNVKEEIGDPDEDGTLMRDPGETGTLILSQQM